MLKKILISSLIAMMFASSAMAVPALQMKDVSYNVVNGSTLDVVFKGETVTIEKINSQSFKVNSQVVPYSKNETFEQLMVKVEKAYKGGKKRSAVLDQLFMSEAHAAIPWFIAAVMGGMVGLGIGESTCSSRQAAESPAYQ